MTYCRYWVNPTSASSRIEDDRHGTRGFRLYDLPIDCRGGGGGPGAGGAAACSFREHLARHDLALSLARGARARGGGRDAGQDPGLAGGERARAGESPPFLRGPRDPGFADRERGPDLSRLGDG